jgi:hypothetical protein
MPISRLAVTVDNDGATWVYAGVDDARLWVRGRPALDPSGRVYFTEVRAGRYEDEPEPGLTPATVSDPVTSVTLRDAPVTAMLSWANTPEPLARITERLDLERAFPGQYVNVEDLEDVAPPRRPPLRLRGAKDPRKKPPKFYEQVAAAYHWLVYHDRDRAPAETLHKANDVPVSSVHRWIKECRRRGLLDPGQRGRAGS